VWVRFSPESDSVDDKPRHEEQIRGCDSHIEWCVVAHALNGSTAESINGTLQLSYPDLELGIYQFMCELRREDLGTRAG